MSQKPFKNPVYAEGERFESRIPPGDDQKEHKVSTEGAGTNDKNGLEKYKNDLKKQEKILKQLLQELEGWVKF